ncbi:hypothetical protein H2248_002315 [Termitomyces sp. 'cryptogamus']|nr:hypothetical protein H2248_002315 [Termitomyces sp. 'cryptogamus']
MDFHFDFVNDPGSSGTPIPLAAGAKRRHAMMMMLDAAPSSASIDGSPLHPHAHAHFSPKISRGSSHPTQSQQWCIITCIHRRSFK